MNKTIPKINVKSIRTQTESQKNKFSIRTPISLYIQTDTYIRR